MKQTKKHIQFIHILFTNGWFQMGFKFNQQTERSGIQVLINLIKESSTLNAKH